MLSSIMLGVGKSRSLILFAVALATTTAQAQSGRRTSSGPPAPSVSGPKTVEKKPDAPQKIQLLVGINGQQAFATIPHYLYDTVLDECIRRLGEAQSVFPMSAGNNLTRSDAVKSAKQERARFVVLLELGSEYADAGKQVKNGHDELYVKYTIFEPGTSKIKQAGQTHQHIYQTGRGGVSLPSKNSPIYSDYSLKQTARDAADRILAALDVKVLTDTTSY